MFYYQNSPVHRLFESCGLSSLSTPPSVAYPKLVQQFYTNLENNGDCYTSFVKGKSLFFTAMDLGSILSILYTGDCPFTLKGPISTPLSPLVQLRIVMDNPTVSSITLPKTTEVSLVTVLHKLLRYNLLPRLGGGADFTYQDLVLVALIMTGQLFNFSLMMLKHMIHCVKHSKKCLPYSCFLTKLFTHFQIPLDDESSIKLTDSIDSNYLKGAHITLLKGKFIRVVPEIPKPIPPTSLPSSPDVLTILHTITNNQAQITSDVKDIQLRLSVLEKGKLPIRYDDLHATFRNVEDEFIDLQAGFELHTRAMVEALQRKMNRNACQLSTELKFISNQIGTLGRFTERRMNDLSEELQADQV